jgi:hypothetical protein
MVYYMDRLLSAKCIDALPSPLLDPSWVQVSQTVELFKTQDMLLVLNTLKGVEGRVEALG